VGIKNFTKKRKEKDTSTVMCIKETEKNESMMITHTACETERTKK
jgi:hypothetical protein